MKNDVIQKLMTPKENGKIAGMQHNLQPQKIESLGKNTQVWAVRIFGVIPKIPRVDIHAMQLVSVALYRLDGDKAQEIYLTASDFPCELSQDKEIYSFGDLMAGRKKPQSAFYGLSVADFVDTIYKHLPKVNQKTRVRLVAFETSENYGPLNLHDLDPRLTLNPAGSGNFALQFIDEAKKQRLKFVDLASFFPDQELEELARRFLAPEQQEQIDTEKGLFSGQQKRAEIKLVELPQKPLEHKHQTKAYVMQAARLTWRVFADMRRVMLQAFGVDPAKYGTPANCAARAYTGKFLKKRISGRSYFIRLQAMRCYWGGRMELFFRGTYQGMVSVYDAVSLYPQACINLGAMPTAESWYRLNPTNLMTCSAGLCEVEFEFPSDEIYPCLPVLAGGNIYFPLAGKSFCTVHEVRYAKELGATIKNLRGWAYDAADGDTSLADFSRELLEKKNRADGFNEKGEKVGGQDYAARTMYKLMMNSLYGKFGQQYVGSYSLETLRQVCRDYDYKNIQSLISVRDWEQMIAEASGEVIPEEKRVGTFWHPEWVALINGYARFIESKAMRGEGGYLTLAGTTDSVVIAHSDDLPDSFQIEGVTFKREIIGDSFTGVRARLYVVGQAGQVVKAALLGAPPVEGIAERVMRWGMDWKNLDQKPDTLLMEEQERKELKKQGKKLRTKNIDSIITVEAPKIERVREGLYSGEVIGKHDTEIWEFSLHTDKGRNFISDDYSLPFQDVQALKTAEEIEVDNDKWQDFR